MNKMLFVVSFVLILLSFITIQAHQPMVDINGNPVIPVSDSKNDVSEWWQSILRKRKEEELEQEVLARKKASEPVMSTSAQNSQTTAVSDFQPYVDMKRNHVMPVSDSKNDVNEWQQSIAHKRKGEEQLEQIKQEELGRKKASEPNISTPVQNSQSTAVSDQSPVDMNGNSVMPVMNNKTYDKVWRQSVLHKQKEENELERVDQEDIIRRNASEANISTPVQNSQTVHNSKLQLLVIFTAFQFFFSV